MSKAVNAPPTAVQTKLLTVSGALGTPAAAVSSAALAVPHTA